MFSLASFESRCPVDSSWDIIVFLTHRCLKNISISQLESNASGKKTPGSQNCSPLNVFVVACDKWSQKKYQKNDANCSQLWYSLKNILFPQTLDLRGASHLIILNCLGFTLAYLRKTWSFYGQKYFLRNQLSLAFGTAANSSSKVWGLMKPRKKQHGVHLKRAPRKKVPNIYKPCNCWVPC